MNSSQLKCIIASLVVLAGCLTGGRAALGEAGVPANQIRGTVKSAHGAEAGVWVIAETPDFQTRFAKIVVSDEAGHYLIPDLPKAKYRVWVRGYGLADSLKIDAAPGHALDLTVPAAPDAATAAKTYPAAYWYAMMKIPEAAQVATLAGGRNGYLRGNEFLRVEPNPVNRQVRAATNGWRRAFTPSCQIPPTAASGARSHFVIRAP
jgi:hypothetical protein